MFDLLTLHPGMVLGWGLFALALFILLSKTFRYIPNNRVGIVEKLWSPKGSVKSGLMALNGEAGFQPEVLRGGWHLLAPFIYRVHKTPLVTIPQGKIGYIYARDGQDLPATQALASNLRARDFQDVRGFIANGGQKGPQRMILREGTYALNLVQFVVLTEDQIFYLPLDRAELESFQKMSAVIAERGGYRPIVIKGTDDVIGIATVHDGASLGSGEIIAPTVGGDAGDPSTYHNNFQDPDKFLKAGGLRGRQLQVLMEGTYYINRLFATIEAIPKTVVEVGTVGVVVSYTGETGTDLSGQEYRHGELVQRGQRGVWSEALMPGKYAFNTYAGKVLMVPTTNFILKWNRAEVGSHKFDENLAEVIYFCDDRYEGIWVYVAHPIILMGSDLKESGLSAKNKNEFLLVSNGSQGINYVVDTNRFVFLGVGYEVKMPSYLGQQHNGDYLEYLVLLPEKIVEGLDFQREGLDFQRYGHR